MPSEAQRRAAGSEGIGDAGAEEEILGAKPARGKRGKPSTKSAEDQAKVLMPDRLEFPIERLVYDKPGVEPRSVKCAFVVPTQPTIGDIVDRRVMADIEAYSQLVLIEVGKVSPIDLSANPKLLFAPENQPYFAVALQTSNTQEFLVRVLSKIAFVEMANGEKYRITEDDIDQVPQLDQVRIGSHIMGDWIRRGLEKKRKRMAQA